jgi:hypothetical protein
MQQVSDNPTRTAGEGELWSDMPLYRRDPTEYAIDYFQEVSDRESGRYIDMDSVLWPHEILEIQISKEAQQIKLDAHVDSLVRSCLKGMSAREKNRMFGYIRGVE